MLQKTWHTAIKELILLGMLQKTWHTAIKELILLGMLQKTWHTAIKELIFPVLHSALIDDTSRMK